jgi:hypothetical protein
MCARSQRATIDINNGPPTRLAGGSVAHHPQYRMGWNAARFFLLIKRYWLIPTCTQAVNPT